MSNTPGSEIAANTILVLLWLAAFAVGVMWVLDIPLPYGADAESVVTVLGMVSTATTAIVALYRKRLHLEEYSTAFALADGYVNNFVEPAVTHLLAKHGPQVIFYIYTPKYLDELAPRAVQHTIARIEAADLKSEVVNLDLEEGRMRDVLTIRSSGSGLAFFDFPSTLLTLKNLVDYRVDSGENRLDEQKKREKGAEYIAKFTERLHRAIEAKDLGAHVRFIDASLEPLLPA